MTGFLGKAKDITGLGLDPNQLYVRAFEKGVLLNRFVEAADTFEKAAKKFAEIGNPQMEAQAAANGLLYRYLGTGNANLIAPLLQMLQRLEQIEEIKSQTNMMSTGPLAAELDCRLVEQAIANAQNDIVRSRDLHKIARDKFQAIMRSPLITYEHLHAPDGHDQKTEMRFFYHSGMYKYYEAMTKKDLDPSTAADDLSEAKQFFNRCNDQKWQATVSTLLDNWRRKSTCWLCHREMQGYELHFSLCHAEVTPYTQALLEQAKQDSTSVNLSTRQIAVCTPCGSMVTFKAQAEADRVRQELNAKLDSVVHAMESRMNDLENKIRWHHH